MQLILDVVIHLPITWGTTVRFYGFTENKREVDKDMREMVDKVKKGEPLYGASQLSEHMQGVAARNSRYTGLWIHFVPWFNFVNHNQVCYRGFILFDDLLTATARCGYCKILPTG